MRLTRNGETPGSVENEIAEVRVPGELERA